MRVLEPNSKHVLPETQLENAKRVSAYCVGEEQQKKNRTTFAEVHLHVSQHKDTAVIRVFLMTFLQRVLRGRWE
jgi:hypothetical protein